MSMLNMPAALLTVQNCDVALCAFQAVWVQEHCCLKREMEVYVFSFLTLFRALLSPSLQQLKGHSPSFWETTAFLTLQACAFLPYSNHIFTSTVKPLS